MNEWATDERTQLQLSVQFALNPKSLTELDVYLWFTVVNVFKQILPLLSLLSKKEMSWKYPSAQLTSLEKYSKSVSPCIQVIICYSSSLSRCQVPEYFKSVVVRAPQNESTLAHSFLITFAQYLLNSPSWPGPWKKLLLRRSWTIQREYQWALCWDFFKKRL